jgi:hypothetical protein
MRPLARVECWKGGPQYIGDKALDFRRSVMDSPIPDVFAMIAAGLTTYIQRLNTTHKFASNGSLIFAGAKPASGISWEMQTRIHACWRWVDHAACSLGYFNDDIFVITALQSRNQGLALWKSSTIPTLFSGID